MIGHQQKQVRPPEMLLLPMPDGFEYLAGWLWKGKLVPRAFATVDRDEVNLAIWVNPKRNLMRQPASRHNRKTTLRIENGASIDAQIWWDSGETRRNECSQREHSHHKKGKVGRTRRAATSRQPQQMNARSATTATCFCERSQRERSHHPPAFPPFPAATRK